MGIYIVQHGPALSKEEDAERPLSEYGKGVVKDVALLLKKSANIKIDEIIHSTKLRSRQTAELIAKTMEITIPVMDTENLEPLDNISPQVMIFENEITNKMIVGHLPYVNRLASKLLCGDENQEMFNYQPGSVLCLDKVVNNGKGKWKVQWMVVPELVEQNRSLKSIT